MHIIQRLAGAFVLAMTLAGLSACATPSVSPAQMDSIRAGQDGAIILSYREWNGMYAAQVLIQNLDTQLAYPLNMHGGTNIVNAGPDMIAVPPGRYRVYSGTLATADATGTMPLLGWWFEDFTVAPGEVVNVGTLRVADIRVTAVPGMSEQVLRAMLTLNPNRSERYLTYSVDYSDEERVRKMLESKYPTLGVAPVQRPLRLRLDREQFERIIVEAYALNPNGTAPTVEQGQERVAAALERYLNEGR